MKGSKWLGQIIKEENIDIFEEEKNVLIIAPTGSGKTYYIFNDLCKDKACLYLCDTRNLKYAINKDIDKNSLDNIETMTYERFGEKVKFDTKNNIINQYDLIVCDEAHNLINFQGFSESPNLAIAQVKLFDKYEHTKIVMFTATPNELNKLVRINDNIDCNFIAKDFRKGYDIKEYANLRKAYFSHFSDIERQLIEYKDYFTLDYQCLIFTPRVDHMKQLEEICIKLELRPISIWSDNNKKYSLTDEQLRIRKHLLENQELHSDYNVLIINRASETGINIENWNKEEKEHKMNLMIIHSLNETQQIQARGRIRHDLELLIIQTEESENLTFAIDENLLDKWLTKETIQEFIIAKNNMRNKNDKLIGMKALPIELEKHGYSIERKRKTINKKKVTMYQIIKID